ncbi:MAG: hypothetical protein WCD42_02035 [Rhizomicrobium sp.]
MNTFLARRTIADSYRYVFGHFGRIIERVWLPATLIFIGGILFVRPYLYLMATSPDSDDLMQHGKTILGLYGFNLIAVFLSAMMAAAIVREVRDPQKEGNLWRFAPPSVGARAMGGMIGLLLLATCALTLVMLATGLLKGTLHLNDEAVVAIIGVFALLLIYPLLRLGYLMVPAANDGIGYGMAQSWQLTKRHFWRILLVGLATALPVFAVQIIVQIVVMGPEILNPHIELYGDITALQQHQSQQMHMMADRFVLISGATFFLTPFVYGLTVVPMTLIYQALTAKQDEAAPADTIASVEAAQDTPALEAPKTDDAAPAAPDSASHPDTDHKE